MIHILANVAIEEEARFIGVFATAGAMARRRHGSVSSEVFRVAGEAGRVVILFAWESRESFEGFLADATVRETMQSSGTIGRPEFTFLEKLVEIPG